MKTVVYAATRNLYRNMAACALSALMNGGIDEVILLIEDDTFPYDLGDNVRLMNVSGQKWFSADGINYDNSWTYMVMMKCVLSKLLPRKKNVLVLDCDTLVEGDLSDLWQLDMSDYYYAAVKQIRTTYPFPYDKMPEDYKYINAGVMFCNLEKLRKDKKDDELIAALNTNKYHWVEEDCITELCQDGIMCLPSRWNRCDFTPADTQTIIRHFAANKSWTHTIFAKPYFEVIDND